MASTSTWGRVLKGRVLEVGVFSSSCSPTLLVRSAVGDMAAQGAAFQEKVSRLLSRKQGKPVLKANRPLVLKDAVANRKPRKGEASCITEMSQLMVCWKQNRFVDGLCSSEVSAFYTCVQKAQAAMKKKCEQSNVPGGRLSPKQATALLRRFPTMRSDI